MGGAFVFCGLLIAVILIYGGDGGGNSFGSFSF